MLPAIEKKCERINGREFMMAPAGPLHNSVGMNLAYIIRNYLRGKKRCKVFYETEVCFDEENRFVPDLLQISLSAIVRWLQELAKADIENCFKQRLTDSILHKPYSDVAATHTA